MPAPTALQRAPETVATEAALEGDVAHETTSTAGNDEVMISTTGQDNEIPSEDLAPVQTGEQAALAAMDIDAEPSPSQPLFAPEKATPLTTRSESRSIRVPPHRMSPLKTNWSKIYPPLVEHLRLQVRMNLAKKAVELRTSSQTTDTGAIQKGADFVQAFCLGFDLDDAIALLRLDDLYIQSFEIKDVKTLTGEHLGRAVGRVAGKDGKTKFAIENASRTRIVLADQKVHILGGFRNIHVAREAVVSLILGSPPGKVYGNLRTVSARMKERF